MDKDFYQRHIWEPIEEWKILGEQLHARGARSIGHIPQIAPKAYAHTIFPPLDEIHLVEFQERLGGRLIPYNYRELLKLANGMYIFPQGIIMYGYIPLSSPKSTSFLDSPANVMIDNGSLMVRGSAQSDITIARYQSDDAYVNIRNDGSIVKFKPAEPMNILECWSNLETWLSSEVSRLQHYWKKELLSN